MQIIILNQHSVEITPTYYARQFTSIFWAENNLLSKILELQVVLCNIWALSCKLRFMVLQISLTFKYSQNECKYNILDLARILYYFDLCILDLQVVLCNIWALSCKLSFMVLQSSFTLQVFSTWLNILGSCKNSLLAIILTCPFLQDRLLSCKMFAVKHLLSKILNLQVVLCKFLHTTCTFLHCLASIVFMGS